MFNELYDSEQDVNVRLDLIQKEILRISNLSNEQQQNILQELSSTLEHNQQIAETLLKLI